MCYNNTRRYAGVMELADVLDSKSCGSDTVSVRPRSPAPKTDCKCSPFLFYLVFRFNLLIKIYAPTKRTIDKQSTANIAPEETGESKK